MNGGRRKIQRHSHRKEGSAFVRGRSRTDQPYFVLHEPHHRQVLKSGMLLSVVCARPSTNFSTKPPTNLNKVLEKPICRRIFSSSCSMEGGSLQLFAKITIQPVRMQQRSRTLAPYVQEISAMQLEKY